jgi:hypothetical protein
MPWICDATEAIPFGHLLGSGTSEPSDALDLLDQVSSVLTYIYPTSLSPRLTNAFAAARAVVAEDAEGV